MTKEVADEMRAIRAKAIAEGRYMLEPNGAKSNLSERNWLLVRTKNYKEWFGDWERLAELEVLLKENNALTTDAQKKLSELESRLAKAKEKLDKKKQQVEEFKKQEFFKITDDEGHVQYATAVQTADGDYRIMFRHEGGGTREFKAKKEFVEQKGIKGVIEHDRKGTDTKIEESTYDKYLSKSEDSYTQKLEQEVNKLEREISEIRNKNTNFAQNEEYERRKEQALDAGGQILRDALRIVQGTEQQVDAKGEGTHGESGSSNASIKAEAARQRSELIKWAKDNKALIVEPIDYLDEQIGDNHIEGTEATTWINEEKGVVTKSITPNHYTTVKELLDSIIIHNMMFPNSAMRVTNIGTSENGISVIVEQPFINDSEVIPTYEEIREYMTNTLGFTISSGTDGSATYAKDGVIVYDINPKNVIKQPNGELVVVDCDAKFTSTQSTDNHLEALRQEYESLKASVSKVVDENGAPKVVHHGSKADNISIFNKGKSTKYVRNAGIYFTSHEKDARRYGKHIYSTFLNIKNPLRIDYKQNSWVRIPLEEVAKQTNISKEELVSIIKPQSDWTIIDYLVNIFKTPDIEDSKKHYAIDQLSEIALSKGYDGMIVENAKDSGKTLSSMIQGLVNYDQYVAFNPNQIKEIQNNGEFSLANDNIYKSSIEENPVYEGVRADVVQEMKDIRSAAMANGTFMKAPNGLDTKLDERNWLLVRTNGFKRWFGDWELNALYNIAQRAWNDKNIKEKFAIGLSDKAKRRFNELLGHDAKQFIITSDAIRHIKNNHGINEEQRGQKNITTDDIIILPYLINNFDSMELSPEHDKRGNKAIKIRKRINGTAVIATIELGENKQFLVTNYIKKKLDAQDASKETPKPNALDESNIAKIQQEIEEIKNSAKNSSKVVDPDTHEPMEVYHGSYSINAFDTFEIQNEAGYHFGTRQAALERVDGNEDYVKGFFLNIKDIESYEDNMWYGKKILNDFYKNNIITKKQHDDIIKKATDYAYRIINEEPWEDETKHFNDYINKEIQKIKGKDYGIAYENLTEDKGSTSYIVFNPNQVKSSTNNDGTFDNNDNSILSSTIEEPLARQVVEHLNNSGLNAVDMNQENVDRLFDEDAQAHIIGEKGAAALDKFEEATTRLDNLNVAREMEAKLTPDWNAKADENARKIKIATGWERGKDGKWRYEIESSKLKAEGLENLMNNPTIAHLNDIVDNQELFTSEKLENTRVVINPNLDAIGATGRVNGNSIELSKNAVKYYLEYQKEGKILETPKAREILSDISSLGDIYDTAEDQMYKGKMITPEEAWQLRNKLISENKELYDLYLKFFEPPILDRVLQHEIQHLIQNKEGFAKGTDGRNKSYKNVAGEVEGRNSEVRSKRSIEQRRQTLLSETEDVAREDQIILEEGLNGVSESRADRLTDNFLTPQGELYGFVDRNGTIHLDFSKITAEHPIHEYTHLWDRAVQQRNPQLWNRGVELMKELDLWNGIKNDSNYGRKWIEQGITGKELDNRITSEVHARLVGKDGQRILENLARKKGNEGIIQKLIDWLSEFWETLADTFGVISKEKLDSMSLEEFNNMTMRDFALGTDLNSNTMSSSIEESVQGFEEKIVPTRYPNFTEFAYLSDNPAAIFRLAKEGLVDIITLHRTN